ncbi:hypothetical protein EHQ59_15695 [Leptospira kemamanensis]|uniref:Peroxiredoxin n=1 Tax=Leptospira kemamanensis TaxID=2484942 RepID=A0A4R9JNA7_9LEPT|nr:hypothetical protein [Leptospira kemamanensis]TGL48907.1 hypothetical protein EHQ59_15695 [Leptospira kemamanensis]
MKVFLGEIPIELYGKKPKFGEPFRGKFQFTPALNTRSRFPNLQNTKGLVFVSTLPNVKSFACSTQVLELEEEIKARKLQAKIIHLASCGQNSWMEIKKLHSHLKAKGYSLGKRNSMEVQTMKQILGVGVINSNRLAHGLFVLLDGKFIASYIPKQQYGVPNIKRFLNKIERRFETRGSK